MWRTNLWDELDRSFAGFAGIDDLRRRMDRVFGDLGALLPVAAESGATSRTWPRVNLFDSGEEFVLQASLPGIAEKDLDISVTAEAVTLAGESRPEAPEGYSVHRQERPAFKFSRTLALPSRVDPEKASATLEQGVLTVRARKVAEAQPRQISVRAG